ncbi:MAG: hypothetical protein AB8B91_03050 [Rubripirellula sp.]
MSDSINPYAPVQITSEPLDDSATRVDFRLTKAGLRHGEDHFLLHAHPIRLLFCSLAMIFASGAAFVWSASQGQVTFWFTAILSLGLSTAIYLTLVHRTKMLVRRQLREHGVLLNTACSVSAVDDHFVLNGSAGLHRWSKEDVKVYRTPRGTLYCPNGSFFIYVPRNNNSPRESYKALREKLK